MKAQVDQVRRWLARLLRKTASRIDPTPVRVITDLELRSVGTDGTASFIVRDAHYR